jgi:DNA-binding transcriptional LysR family regulator
MDFKQIEAFVNVVRHKSFSKAADATFFTQPTISTHISVLEKELGTKLLDRRGRTIEMTPQGRQFYKYAVEMVNTRAKAIEEINAQSGAVELSGFTAKGLAARHSVEASYGDILVRLPKGADVGFHLESPEGSVSTDLAGTVRSAGSRRLVDRPTPAGGGELRLIATTGGVTVQLQ